MKLLVCTDLYPIKATEKETPRTIYDFVQGWKAFGHNVQVIKPNFLFNSFLRKKPFYKSGVYNDVENINYFLPFLGNISNKIKTDNLQSFDYIIAHMPSGIIFADKLKEKLSLTQPLIAAVHISDLEVLTKPLYSVYFKTELEKAYANSSKIACRSDILRKKFIDIYPQFADKTFVAYSGIEPDIIKKRNWNPKSKIKVLTCANLKKRKNVDKVINACNGFDNIELTVIGNGSEFKNLQKIKAGNVTFTGHLQNSQVLEMMSEADIFILPSQNETFGMVYLEAMASGCITVGLENDGIDGIIKNGENGYLCSLSNIKEVLTDIINSNNQNTILENCYNTIVNYTKEKAAENYMANICG